MELIACLHRKAKAGLQIERALGPVLVAPPRRAHLLGNSTGNKKDEGPEVTVNTGSTAIECDSTKSFPSTGVDQGSELPETHRLTGSTENGERTGPGLPVSNIDNSPALGMRSPQSHQGSGSTVSESGPRIIFPSNRSDEIPLTQESTSFIGSTGSECKTKAVSKRDITSMTLTKLQKRSVIIDFLNRKSNANRECILCAPKRHFPQSCPRVFEMLNTKFGPSDKLETNEQKFNEHRNGNKTGKHSHRGLCDSRNTHKMEDCSKLFEIVMRDRPRKTIVCSRCHTNKSLVLFNCACKRKSQNTEVQFATIANTEPKTGHKSPIDHERDKEVDIITIDDDYVSKGQIPNCVHGVAINDCNSPQCLDEFVIWYNLNIKQFTVDAKNGPSVKESQKPKGGSLLMEPKNNK